MPAFMVLLVSTSSPSLAKNPPRGDVDAIALLALAPRLCGLNTKARWDAAMTATATKYGITIPALTVRVKKAMGEISEGLAKYPGEVAGTCAAIRRTR